jgi:Asp-tRNA(Asn)/Glu-tRNA(Gln) amidotransferase A subunit family amidase
MSSNGPSTVQNKFCATLPNFVAEREAFLSGRSTPRDLLEACIENIERSENVVRAFAHLDLESARSAADRSTKRYRVGRPLSPIDGMPIGVKDIIDTSDMPTGMNNAYFHGYRPRVDAACVRATREGGGIVLGKTVTTEFAIGRSGPTVNPHNPAHTPGGSSSGSGAGAGAGMFCAGFGTQTQGSIVRPASFNGVVGFKPTLGALSTDGVHPLSRSHDHLGALGQSVDSVWALARWIGERAPGQDSDGIGGDADGVLTGIKPARLAVPRTAGFDELDDASRAAFDARLDSFRAAGITVVEPEDDSFLADVTARLNRVVDVSIRMVAFDMHWPYAGYVDAAPEHMGPRIHDLVKLGREVSLDEYRMIRAEREDLRRRVAELGRSYDAVALPAASGPAPEGFEYTGARTFLLYWSFIGFPAVSLPLMRVGDMPFGLQLAGFGGRDHALMQVAKHLCEAFG